MSKRCRICLCLKPRRDITELKITESSTEPAYSEIILFCLDITVDKDSKLGTKLCVKCHRKILEFYEFKTMAQRNNPLISNIAENTKKSEEVEIKHEVVNLPSSDEFCNEETNYNINEQAITETDEQCNSDVKNEDSTYEDEIEHKEQSEDETNLIENIKEEIENVPEDTAASPMVLLPTKKSKTKPKDTHQTCLECNKPVKDMKTHMITHLPPEERENLRVIGYSRKSSGFCKECGKVVNRLQEHMQKHLPVDIWKKQRKGEGLAGTCKVCGKTVKRLKKHMVIHLPEFQRKIEKSTDPPVKGNKKGPVKCLMCSREFVAQQYLDMHMKNLHLRPKKQCPVCNKKVNKLKMHMLTAHNRDQLQFECDWCGMKHATRYILEKHIAIHTNDRPFVCDDCGKKFIQRSALIIHQRQVHLKIRPFLCQFCSKTYCTGEALKVHVRGAHTKERPFKCSDCGKGFNTKNLLKSHMEHVHTHVKNYSCTLCPKKYKTQVEVSRHHKEVHLKIKNYHCRFCESRFFRSTHLRRHEFTIHERYAGDKADR